MLVRTGAELTQPIRDWVRLLLPVCVDPDLDRGGRYLGHVVDQQQRHGDGGDVVRAADLQDVPQAHDGRVAGRDASRPQVVVHTQVEDDVDLRQVGVSGDVELT